MQNPEIERIARVLCKLEGETDADALCYNLRSGKKDIRAWEFRIFRIETMLKALSDAGFQIVDLTGGLA